MNIEIKRTCPFCGKISSAIVDENQFKDWENGIPALEAFPQLSTAERAILILDMCIKCQDGAFQF